MASAFRPAATPASASWSPGASLIRGAAASCDAAVGEVEVLQDVPHPGHVAAAERLLERGVDLEEAAPSAGAEGGDVEAVPPSLADGLLR